MMTVKELIIALMDCDMDDDIYINILNGSDTEFYIVDGLENVLNEYRGNPTLATLGVIK
jgi:hypothetical protein